MTIFSLYIFDRHCNCVYYQDWHRSLRPKPAAEGNLPPTVARAVTFQAAKPADVASNSPVQKTMLKSSSGVVVAVNEQHSSSGLRTTPITTEPMSALSFDEEVKLVYGVVLSLKNMVKKISGRNESFVSYRTSTYKLHFLETMSGYRFLLLSHPAADSLRSALRQLYAGPFLEFVVRNPAVPMDSRERGIDNELFRSAANRLVRSLPSFS